MLVQKALQELDGEIDRLSRIRAIVASLHSTHSPTDYNVPQSSSEQVVEQRSVAATLPAAQVHTEDHAAVLPKRQGRKLRFERSTRTHRPAPPVARALGGTIPVRPVFIASGNVARPVAAPAASRAPAKMEPPSEGTLDALLRELSFRPNSQRA